MDPDKAREHIIETARFILGGTAGDMLDESAEELAQQILDLDGWLRRGGFRPAAWHRDAAPAEMRQVELEKACRGLLQDIDEVLERQGEEWWDETVTSRTHHRQQAEKLTGEGAS